MGSEMCIRDSIGSPRMNFLPGRITSETKTGFKVALDGFDGTSLTLARARDRKPESEKVMVGIRPEHISPSGKVKLAVNVDLVEDLGGTSFAYVSTADGTSVTVEVRDNTKMPSIGATRIAFDPGDAFLFDRTSELRL